MGDIGCYGGGDGDGSLNKQKLVEEQLEGKKKPYQRARGAYAPRASHFALSSWSVYSGSHTWFRVGVGDGMWRSPLVVVVLSRFWC